MLVVADRIGHVVADIAEFVDGDVVEAFSAAVEMLVDFDGCLLHDGVSFLAAAEQDEILATGEPGVPVVVIKSQPQQSGGLGFLVGRSHR